MLPFRFMQRKRVALMKGLDNTPAGLVQLGIVHGDAHKGAFAKGQGAFPDRVEELLRIRLGAAVQVVFSLPRQVLAATGPKGSRDGAPPQTHQGSQSLPHRAHGGAPLGESAAPTGGNVESFLQKSHRSSPLSPKVFLSVRTKRSSRATFLVSEDTRLSRSTATPKAVWMRCRSSLI